MKKTLIIFAVMLALVACNKETIEIKNSVPMVETNGIKVNIAISRADEFGATKASVKSDWADNDVVFVFFKGVAAPKYLEMKYDGGTWTSTAKNGLAISDLSGAANKKMTAVYLPYGSTATVSSSEGDFIFSNMTYSGYFLKAELVDYTVESDVLSGSLSMSAPTLSNSSDKLIHFDISGFTSGHEYKLYQDYVKPLTFASVSSDGAISKIEGSIGAAITGYEDGSMMSFSGILDASAVGNAVDYQFTIDDETSSKLYTRDAGTKTVSASKYIGIGAINDTEKWKAFEYVDLGLSVRWATFNVGATSPEEYGDYYAWGETDTKSNYSWSSYKYCNILYSNSTLTKYCYADFYGYEGFTDTKTILDSEDDVAYVKWGGNWRIPTNEELNDLNNQCTWTWCASGNAEFGGVAGYKVTSNNPGYTNRFIFLPAAGSRIDTRLEYDSSSGSYWSSSLGTDYPLIVPYLYFNSDYHAKNLYSDRSCGHSVRPVCP